MAAVAVIGMGRPHGTRWSRWTRRRTSPACWRGRRGRERAASRPALAGAGRGSTGPTRTSARSSGRGVPRRCSGEHDPRREATAAAGRALQRGADPSPRSNSQARVSAPRLAAGMWRWGATGGRGACVETCRGKRGAARCRQGARHPALSRATGWTWTLLHDTAPEPGEPGAAVSSGKGGHCYLRWRAQKASMRAYASVSLSLGAVKTMRK